MTKSKLRSVLAVFALAGLLFAPAVQANFFYDRPYPDIDWLALETEHFIIYYYPAVERTARLTAKYAEIAYPKVTGLFDYPLKEKIHIVVRDQEDYANGWAAYNFDQITEWATPLASPLRGRQEWIPDMFSHEFSHIISLKANDWKAEAAVVAVGSGLVEDGVHNVDFGAQLFIGRSAPFFWIEGIAEYGCHMAGFNWWTTARDMTQRMSMLEDNYLDYEEMFEVYSRDSSFDRERGYQQGYTMGLYVMEKYGKEAWAQLGVNSGQKGHLMWEKNIEEVLGIDGKKLFDGYLKWMKDRYKRQVAPIRKDEHKGFPIFPDSDTGYVEVLEKLPDGRQKLEVGPAQCIPKEYEEPETLDTITRILFKDAAKAEEFRKAPPWKKSEMMNEAQKKASAEEKEELNEALEPIQEKYSLGKPKTVYWDKDSRKLHMEAVGQYILNPATSPDGKYIAQHNRMGIVLQPLPLEENPQYTGYCIPTERQEEIQEDSKMIAGARMMHGYSFSPDSKKVMFTSLRCPHTWLPCVSFSGYYRLDLYEYDIESEDIEKITDQMRAFYPSYSPDGQTIAFVHIEDGNYHLGLFPAEARHVTIDGKCEIEGEERENCVKWLIKKNDGTILGQPSWSPDGTRLVFDLYRNHQQDVWMINADGSGLKPLTWDRAEDRDGQFTPDGEHILYSSDRSGIFNIYKLHLATGKVTQLTNVISGVYTPHLTAAGDMLYAYFTSYGFRIYAHKKENFYNKEIDAGYDVSPEEVARNLAYEEPLPEIREHSESYNPFHPKNWAPPIGIPMFRYEQKGMQIGAQMLLLDALDKHLLFTSILLGQHSVYAISYENKFWYPVFRIGYAYVEVAYEFAQGFGSSERPDANAGQVEPHFEAPVNYKNRQAYHFAWAGMSYKLAPQFEVSADYSYLFATSKRSSGGKEQAFLTNNSYTLSAEYSDVSPYGAENDVNPRGGRKLNFDYMFTRTGLPTKDWADVEWLGRTNPPGDHSDDYTYHELQMGYTEYIPVSWWNKAGKHTLEIHLRGGWQDRNVYRWDEFFAGSLHPLRYVPTHSTTHEFAGYEDFSLRGETMMILGLAYRFPFARMIDQKLGPFYFVSLWGEFSGTMGNLWGYTADYDYDKYGNIYRNDESYWDPKVKPGTVRREVPFKDVASKNGNYMLYDVSFTLKLKAFIFGTTGWNSFLRIAYGLNDIVGQYEVNDDYAYVDAFPNNALYAEAEPKSLRLSIGIGSDF